MPTILFVDDNANVRDFWRREFERNGFRVRLAASGGDAVRSVELECPDLVILDVQTREMDGFATLSRMLTLRKDLRIVIYSSQVRETAAGRRHWPATQWVEKEESPQELMDTVTRLLTRTPRRSWIRDGHVKETRPS